VLKVNDSGGLATYSIAYDGGEAVGASRLGILFRDHHGFECDLAIVSSAAATNDQTWEQHWGERRIVRDNHHELAVTFASQEGTERQMAADLPENYEARMDAFQSIKDVEADWEESVAIAGEVGDYVVIARKGREGGEWFLGAVTDEASHELSIPLSFLEEGRIYTAQVYRDGPHAHWDYNPYDIVIEEIAVVSGDP
jgi:hypothetical protein